jgi:hypothetical protein
MQSNSDKNKMKKIIIFFILISFTLPGLAMAAGITGLIPCTNRSSNDEPIKDGSGNILTVSGLYCNSWPDLVGVIQFFINYAMIIATLLATVSFAFAGWLYLTSNDNGAQIQRAHGIFLTVLKGFLFMALAYLLVKTILGGIALPEYSKLQ